MKLETKFGNRIDSDSGYDNLKLAQDLVTISEKHYAKQLLIPRVSNSALVDDKIPECKAGTHRWDYHKRYMQKSCTVCDVHYLA